MFQRMKQIKGKYIVKVNKISLNIMCTIENKNMDS